MQFSLKEIINLLEHTISGNYGMLSEALKGDDADDVFAIFGSLLPSGAILDETKTTANKKFYRVEAVSSQRATVKEKQQSEISDKIKNDNEKYKNFTVENGNKNTEYKIVYNDHSGSSFTYVISVKPPVGIDLHEFITAVLCVMGISKINQFENIINASGADGIRDKDMYDVIGICNKEVLDFYEANLDNIIGAKDTDRAELKQNYSSERTCLSMCKAISAAEAILSNNQITKADKVYLTGKKWEEDVAGFKMSVNGMDSYNSSDIICVTDKETNKKIIGVSLKHKDTETTANPPVLNKSLPGLVKALDKEGNFLKKLNSTMSEFFSSVFNKCTYPEVNKTIDELLKKTGKDSVRVDVLGMPEDNNDDLVSKKSVREHLFNETNSLSMVDYLVSKTNNSAMLKKIITSADSYFKDIYEIFREPNFKAMILKPIINLAFKVDYSDTKEDLRKIEDTSFFFAMCTGMAKYTKKEGFQIYPGKYHSYENIITALDKVVGNDFDKNIDIIKPDNKLAAWEDGTEAMSLPLDIISYATNPPTVLANINLRYKGDYNWKNLPEMIVSINNDFM